MFNYDAEKRIASITVDPVEFDIDDLVGAVQGALDTELEACCEDGFIDIMNADDYRNLCNLIFERAKYV